MKGFSFLDNDLMTPDSLAISISPTQKDMTPIIVMQREIASLAESNAALVTDWRFPVNAANIIPVKIMKAHKKLSIEYPQ